MVLGSQALDTALSGLQLYTLAAGVGMAAMVVPTVLASQAVGTFDDNLQTIIGIGEDYSDKLSDMASVVNNLAVAFGASQDDISAAGAALVKVGYSYDQVFGQNGMLTEATQLAVANQMSATDAANIMNYAYLQFGKQSGESMTQMADDMQKATHVSAMSMSDLDMLSRMLFDGLDIWHLLPTVPRFTRIAVRYRCPGRAPRSVR